MKQNVENVNNANKWEPIYLKVEVNWVQGIWNWYGIKEINRHFSAVRTLVITPKSVIVTYFSPWIQSFIWIQMLCSLENYTTWFCKWSFPTCIFLHADVRWVQVTGSHLSGDAISQFVPSWPKIWITARECQPRAVTSAGRLCFMLTL